MKTTERQWQDFIDSAGEWFDFVHTPQGMQLQCEQFATTLDEIGYDDDFEALCDFFDDMPAWETRMNPQGEFESQLVYISWGSPWITFDSATGEVAGSFGIGNTGSAFIGEVALRHINEFFRTLHDC